MVFNLRCYLISFLFLKSNYRVLFNGFKDSPKAYRERKNE